MDSGELTRTLLAAWIATSGMVALHAARAETPFQKVTISVSRESKAGAESVAPPTAIKLDLRLPAEAHSGDASAATPLEAGFSIRNHRLLPDESATRHDSHAASSTESTHIMSPMQRLAHNFRQEGLPLAKLFQNNDSLVHLGLNPRGKPGLWLVHKLH